MWAISKDTMSPKLLPRFALFILVGFCSGYLIYANRYAAKSETVKLYDFLSDIRISQLATEIIDEA